MNKSDSAIENLLKELNQQQHKAATLGDQHALVLAGAGTGKTKTIIARAAYLIHTGVDPRRIQILTFTRRAAQEIVSRVKLCLGDKAQELGASTFHAWSMRLIRANPGTFGTEKYTVIDQDDQTMIFKILRGRKDKKEIPTAASLRETYSYARCTGKRLIEAMSEKMPNYLENEEIIAGVMKGYEGKKRASNYLDYDDILDIVSVQIEESNEVLDWLANQYDHILIDELQDMNPAQWRLVKPLQNGVVLYGVGDDAQSIYRFRGADFTTIHNFSKNVPGSIVLKLEDNYRSYQSILDVSNWLLSQSPLGYGKVLTAVRGDSPSKPQLHDFSDENKEAAWLCSDIKRRFKEGAAWKNHMILVRTSFVGRTIEAAFLEAEIPYRYVGGAKLLESAHVRDVLSALRIVANLRDDIALMRFLTCWPGVGEVSATKMIKEIRLLSVPEELPKTLAKQHNLPAQAVRAISETVKYRGNVSQALRYAFKEMEKMLEFNYQHREWDIRKKDFELLERLAKKHNTISEFMDEYLLDPVYGSEISHGGIEDAVTLITIHSAKGTEALTCYVIDVSPGSFPFYKATTEDSIEEERRILYVALTRAQNELLVTRRGRKTWASSEKNEGYFFNELPNQLFDEYQNSCLSRIAIRKPPKNLKAPKVGIRF